ncbi:acyl-CoA reductase-like NAD-dependent aldehyde dehydrogenase [Halopolyspora algeriensis]|uniref:Acyl-CoA reductase-like NAD-dependent aldehyde dehydrogenase n=1 Tax=Halopolyspora algeriensis TaxID=1500506 RepID=A0A368VJL0_9ACTN|nr:aldehyde dehydrogenase family protein [Halopolyspora algeriensis]RCW40952.1 acyl-CoA reductase-like NAD-dependent aldehyde dehydrogenase [Halopolyspora algeriensis]TQM53964.1 acyl-CoA reductase-like NAD-dependent aldehyde dehydrogenase [Halopolyspora algeriensis]
MTVSSDQLPEIRTELFINGETRNADDALPVIDPADGVSTVGYAAAANAEQAESAVAAAHRAFPAWAARTPQERAALLTEALAPLEADRPATAEVLTRENGKIRQESHVDSMVFAHRFTLAAGLAEELEHVTHLPAPPYRTEISYRPLGVVTIIVPFNWPLAILAASLPQALLAGNTVVVKPPPTAPLATVRTVELVARSLPPGVLNVVTGTDAEIGAALIQDDRVKKVCFTGSTNGGKRIMSMAAESLTRVALELGGNDPAIVLADADLGPETMQRLFSGTFDSTGQICMAIKRLYVHRSRYDEVVEGLSEILSATRLGHGLDENVTMGPLHSRQQLEYVRELTAQARQSGAEVREFGQAAEGGEATRGNFLSPSLVLDPADDARVVAEEQFGPTLPILPFDDEDDAVARANDTWSGLCSSIWTPDLDRAALLAARLRTGYTFVNAHGAAHLDERAPFGGFNHSGMGREMGIEGVREFMDTQAVGFPA